MAGDDLGGLLGSLLGQGTPSGGEDGKDAASAGSVLGALLSAVGHAQSGGANPLGGLLDLLAGSGLAAQKDSWVGTGQNRSVTGPQLQQALPDETIRHVAEETGVTPDRAADEIARSLPQVVDRLTPAGQVPADASLEELVRRQQPR